MNNTTGSLSMQEVRFVLRALWRRRYVIAIGMLMAPMMAWGISSLSPPRYKAQAEVLVEDAQQANPFLDDMIVPWKVKDRLPVIQSILRSQVVLQRILMKMNRLPKDASLSRIDSEVRSLRRQIEVFGVGGGLVRISYTAGSPEAARDGLQLIVDTFLQEMLGPQTRAIEDSAVFLASQLERLKGELTSLESETATFKRDNADDLPEVYRLNLDAYLDTKKALLAAESKLEAGLRRKTVLEDRLATFDPVTKDVESAMVKKSTQLAELRARFTDAHPEVQRLSQEVAGLRAQLRSGGNKRKHFSLTRLENLAQVETGTESQAGTANSVVKTSDLMTSELLTYKALLAEIEGVRGEISLLERRTAEAHDSLKAYADNEASLGRLVRETQIKSDVYRTLLQKYEDALVTRELARFDQDKQVWLVDPPTAPTAPMGAPLIAVLIGAVFGGGILASALAIVLELIAQSARSLDDAARRLGVAPLGQVPRRGAS